MAADEQTPYTQEKRREVVLDVLSAFQISEPWIGGGADLAAADRILDSTDHMHQADLARAVAAAREAAYAEGFAAGQASAQGGTQ